MLDLVGLALYASTVGLAGTVGYALFSGGSKSSTGTGPRNNKITTHKELSSLKGTDGYVLTKNIQYSHKTSLEHVIILGPTGSGKTSKVIKHNVSRLDNCSIICTDPSGDIAEQVKKDGFDTLIFNPLDVSCEIGFDPLYNCKTTAEVRNVMETLLINGLKSSNTEAHSDFQKWAKLSIPLVNVYALYNYKYKKYKFGDMMYRLLTVPIAKYNEVVVDVVDKNGVPMKDPTGKQIRVKQKELDKNCIEAEIRDSADEELIAEYEGFKQSIGSPECLANIRLTLSSGLALFRDSQIRNLCNKPPIDYKRFRYFKSVYYIQIPEKTSEFYYPIVAVMIQQIMDVTIDTQGGLPIMFVLDELCNIGLVPRFDKVLSTVRRYNIGVMGCTQSIAQFEDLYGPVRTKTILENFNTRVALGGLGDSADYFSKLLGFTLVERNEVEVEKTLMQPSEVRMLSDDEVLIIYKNKRGVIDKMLNHY